MSILDNIVGLLPTSLHDLGYKIDTVELSPVFLCVHYCLVALSLRNQAGAFDYSHQHPFPSWFVCVTSCFGGTLIQNFLLGKPIIAIYLNTNNLVMASAVWYLVFFAPMDVAAKLCQIKGVKVLLLLLKEVHRLRGIKNGVIVASKLYSGSWFVAILIGSIRGSGAKFIGRPLFHFIQGNLKAENEFLHPTFSTKHSVVTATLLLLQLKGVIDIDEKLLLCIIFLVAGSVQVLLLMSDICDPYTKVEACFCKLFLELPNELTSKDCKKKVE